MEKGIFGLELRKNARPAPALISRSPTSLREKLFESRSGLRELIEIA